MFSINSSISKHTEPVSYSGTVKIKSKTNAQVSKGWPSLHGCKGLEGEIVVMN